MSLRQLSSMLRNLRVVCCAMLLMGVQSAALAQETPAVQLPIGMNLSGINDYRAGYPFKNLMWGARPWLTRNAEGQSPWNTEMISGIPLDADGYPLEVPFTPDGADQPQHVFTLLPNLLEPGDYVLLHEGEGTFTGLMNTTVKSAEPGRVQLTMAHKKGSSLEGIIITSSTKGNHLRNIRVVRKEEESADLQANPFREDFLDYCRQWHALRFMDWALTNNSLEKEWADRKRSTFYTMVGSNGDAVGRTGNPATEFQHLFSGGVAIEIMIQLANMTETDPWFCMPHRATPEYMNEFAKLVKAELDPQRTVYVEYSNEVWNWQFQQAQWMLNSKVAADAVLAAGGQPWKDGVEPAMELDDGMLAREGGTSHPERMGALGRRCFEQWESVFTGADRERMVRVVGVQHASLDIVRRVANWVMANGGADALSPAGYFGPHDEVYKRWEAAGAALTADQVIADMDEAFEARSAKWTRQNAEIAKQHGLRYIVYEGGQHIQPRRQQVTDYMPALKEAQYHPGMYDIYMKNLALHQEIGCDLFAAFASVGDQGSRYGSWGHQEYYGQPPEEMPKLRALLDANTPRED